MIPRDFGKKLSEIQNVGVTITPGSPREWTTRAVECYYNAASEQKCAGIKRPSPARRQNIGWSSSSKQKENQRPTHWSDRASRPQSAGSDRLFARPVYLSIFLEAASSATELASREAEAT